MYKDIMFIIEKFIVVVIIVNDDDEEEIFGWQFSFLLGE
jgi:hypothetical protein